MPVCDVALTLEDSAVPIPPEGGWSIWSNDTFIIAMGESELQFKKFKQVKYSSMQSATLQIFVNADVAPSWGNIAVNGVKVQDIDFRYGGGQVELSVDITSRILQGSNVFTLVMQSTPGIGEGPWVVTVNLYINGTNVSVTDDWFANMMEWVKSNPLVFVGVGLGAAGVALLVAKKFKKKR